MGDVLSALVPPAVVATVFCAFIIKLLRREMAPRTSDGRLVSEADADRDADSASRAEAANTGTGPSSEADTVAQEDEAKDADDASPELTGDDESPSTGR